MNEKELYRQKLQAELDEWKAENAKLKAKASGAKADVQIAMQRQVAALEHRLEDAQEKLAELAEAGEDAWHSLKKGVESAWESLQFAFKDNALRSKN